MLMARPLLFTGTMVLFIPTQPIAATVTRKTGYSRLSNIQSISFPLRCYFFFYLSALDLTPPIHTPLYNQNKYQYTLISKPLSSISTTGICCKYIHSLPLQGGWRLASFSFLLFLLSAVLNPRLMSTTGQHLCLAYLAWTWSIPHPVGGRVMGAYCHAKTRTQAERSSPGGIGSSCPPPNTVLWRREPNALYYRHPRTCSITEYE